jgi:hypothetical protein
LRREPRRTHDDSLDHLLLVVREVEGNVEHESTDDLSQQRHAVLDLDTAHVFISTSSSKRGQDSLVQTESIVPVRLALHLLVRLKLEPLSPLDRDELRSLATDKRCNRGRRRECRAVRTQLVDGVEEGE